MQVNRRLVAILPDACFVIEMPEGELHFFLEFDRGAENLKFFKRKMDAYLTYFRSGKCNARYGMDKVRVLTVNEGGQTGVDRRRLVNLRRVTEEMGGRRRFWFSSLAEIVDKEVLSADIWQVAGDLRVGILVPSLSE
ncbi:MAG: replication-relaxation family protein [Candidatus Aminicenantaceae bacterium]